METQFVTYEIALNLKKLGYESNSATYYDEDGKLRIFQYPEAFYNSNKNIFQLRHFKNLFNRKRAMDTMCIAPTWTEAIVWLYETHSLFIDVYPIIHDAPSPTGVVYNYEIQKSLSNSVTKIQGLRNNKGFTNLYKAYEVAILQVINLIKI